MVCFNKGFKVNTKPSIVDKLWLDVNWFHNISKKFSFITRTFLKKPAKP